jgi:hypothetical protein
LSCGRHCLALKGLRSVRYGRRMFTQFYAALTATAALDGSAVVHVAADTA